MKHSHRANFYISICERVRLQFVSLSFKTLLFVEFLLEFLNLFNVSFFLLDSNWDDFMLLLFVSFKLRSFRTWLYLSINTFFDFVKPYSGKIGGLSLYENFLVKSNLTSLSGN